MHMLFNQSLPVRFRSGSNLLRPGATVAAGCPPLNRPGGPLYKLREQGPVLGGQTVYSVAESDLGVLGVVFCKLCHVIFVLGKGRVLAFFGVDFRTVAGFAAEGLALGAFALTVFGRPIVRCVRLPKSALSQYLPPSPY